MSLWTLTCHIFEECSLITNFQNSPKNPLIPRRRKNRKNLGGNPLSWQSVCEHLKISR
jgi:hypothetical protein